MRCYRDIVWRVLHQCESVKKRKRREKKQIVVSNKNSQYVFMIISHYSYIFSLYNILLVKNNVVDFKSY